MAGLLKDKEANWWILSSHVTRYQSWGPKTITVKVHFGTWRSGYCYLNKGEYNLNESKDDSFVERVVKNNSWNNGDRHKIRVIFLINCFVFVITLVWKTVHSLAMTQIKAHLMGKQCNYGMFHVTWTTFKFNRNQLGTVSAFVMMSVP